MEKAGTCSPVTISHWSKVAAQGDRSLTVTSRYDAWWLQIGQHLILSPMKWQVAKYVVLAYDRMTGKSSKGNSNLVGGIQFFRGGAWAEPSLVGKERPLWVRAVPTNFSRTQMGHT